MSVILLAFSAATTSTAQIPMHLRPVRVLVAEGVPQVAVRSAGPITIKTATGELVANHDAAHDLTFAFRTATGGMKIGGRQWPHRDLYAETKTSLLTLMTPGQGEQKEQLENTFPGRLRVIGEDNGLLVINEVDMEDYVASVVASEVWPNFAEEAFRAQAIATRTYVLYQMLRRTSTPYDVCATQGSQVYRGVRTDAVGQMAAQAAHYTRGLVCTWNDGGNERVFCTYYSAACGGMSQSAAPLGAEGDIPPLAGGVRCDYCRIAPGQTYRWGPVRVPLREAYQRLSERYPEMSQLQGIRKIEPEELTRFGRPLTWKITGVSGDHRSIVAERFRLVVGPNAIRSTDCNVRVSDSDLVFENGKGFGHGLGLCQWGMQGQALEGKNAGQILEYYFPGSRLTRVY